ncbi:DUF3592 domain-containing protein [Spirillospora sp. NPDC052269]
MSISAVPVLVCGVFALLGLALTGWGGRELRAVVRDLRTFVPAVAEVVGVRQDGVGEDASYHPVVRFQDASGHRIEAAARYGDRAPSAREGTTVEVRYDPANPSDVIVAGWWRSGAGTWTLCVAAGLVFLVVGVLGLTYAL